MVRSATFNLPRRDGVPEPDPAPARPSRRDRVRPALGAGSSRRTGALIGLTVLAYVALTVTLTASGRLLTDAAALRGVRNWDLAVTRWFASHRGTTVDLLSAIGSHLAETLTVIGAATTVIAVLWWRRRDLPTIAAFAGGLMLEVTVFLSTTVLVGRARPPVPRLDSAPPTSSFPSGHAAAAMALSLGVVLVLRAVTKRGVVVQMASVALLLLPVAVGFARVSRGMHQPTDVIAGTVLGIACVAVAHSIVRPPTRLGPVGAGTGGVSR